MKYPPFDGGIFITGPASAAQHGGRARGRAAGKPALLPAPMALWLRDWRSENTRGPNPPFSLPMHTGFLRAARHTFSRIFCCVRHLSPPQRSGSFFARPFCKKAVPARPRRSAFFSAHRASISAPAPFCILLRRAAHPFPLPRTSSAIARRYPAPQRLSHRHSVSQLLCPYSKRVRRPARSGGGRAFLV